MKGLAALHPAQPDWGLIGTMARYWRFLKTDRGDVSVSQ